MSRLHPPLEALQAFLAARVVLRRSHGLEDARPGGPGRIGRGLEKTVASDPGASVGHRLERGGRTSVGPGRSGGGVLRRVSLRGGGDASGARVEARPLTPATAHSWHLALGSAARAPAAPQDGRVRVGLGSGVPSRRRPSPEAAASRRVSRSSWRAVDPPTTTSTAAAVRYRLRSKSAPGREGLHTSVQSGRQGRPGPGLEQAWSGSMAEWVPDAPGVSHRRETDRRARPHGASTMGWARGEARRTPRRETRRRPVDGSLEREKGRVSRRWETRPFSMSPPGYAATHPESFVVRRRTRRIRLRPLRPLSSCPRTPSREARSPGGGRSRAQAS